ncbi:MAG: hypothetical protein RLZ71_796 [Actinomycetota bacterium]|jgi:1,4-dihydroxy-2-naphthoate octaprenyltransferase
MAKTANNKKKIKQPKVTWIQGARLRTLPLAVAPIVLAFGIAVVIQSASFLLTGLALAVAVFLQIGVNFANDYSDGIRGTDANRVGPGRLTGSGSKPAKQVLIVALSFFALAAIAGGVIVLLTAQWWLLAVGAAAIVAAWFYTGGKRPYGYAGLGELFVFVFFGLVATVLTVEIQVANLFLNPLLTLITFCGASAMGFFATAVLMVNNIRDIDTDKVSGKRTLAVRVGARWSKALYFAMIWLPMILLVPFLVYKGAFLTFAVLLILLPLTLIVATSRTAKEYILALKLTSFAALAYAVLLAFGMQQVL